MKRISTLIFLAFSLNLQAEFINIGIYYSESIRSFEFSIRAGKYALFSEKGKISELDSEDKIQVSYTEQSINVKKNGALVGNYQKINFVGVGWYNHFMVKPLHPKLESKRYDDNLKVLTQREGIQLINNIDLDNYVAGVVEAEVGRKPPREYFKLQAIICRTYALSNTHKHLLEGFNLCDEVHCQAYHGKSFFSPIVEAAMQTRGAVIVDSDIQLITAAFHSNCGGQTVNSEDVWIKSLYYLRSVEDSFCLEKKNSVWEKRIQLDRWHSYVNRKLSGTYEDSARLPYLSASRETFFPTTGSGLSFEDLRNYFGLRSTFFNVTQSGDQVVLHGKGYGHGVGLCQEGAMEMAARGYNYSQILHFYYKGVHIIDLSALDFFKSE